MEYQPYPYCLRAGGSCDLQTTAQRAIIDDDGKDHTFEEVRVRYGLPDVPYYGYQTIGIVGTVGVGFVAFSVPKGRTRGLHTVGPAESVDAARRAMHDHLRYIGVLMED